MITRLSVCIPTHNRAGLLHQMLQSLMELRLMPTTNWEIIVVANCCQDDTVRMANSMAAQLPAPLRVMEEAEPGVVAARNCAVHHARGEIIAFLDDDVQVYPAWLGELIAAFAIKQPDILVGRVLLDWHGLSVPTWFDADMGQYLAEVDLGDSPLYLQSPLGAAANLAFTRAMLERVGKFRCPLSRHGRRTAGEDTDLIARALRQRSKVLYCPTVAVKHHLAPERLTIRYLSRVAHDVGLAEYLIAPPPRFSLWAWNLAKKTLRFIVRALSWLMVWPWHRRAAARLRVSMAKTRGNIGGLIWCAVRTIGTCRSHAIMVEDGISVPTAEIIADERGIHRQASISSPDFPG